MLTKQEVEIQIKLQAIASVFAEYLAYYKPIYQKAIDSQAKAMPRAKRREFEQNANKAMNETIKMAFRFSNFMEKAAPDAQDEMIDYLTEALNKIEFTHTKN